MELCKTCHAGCCRRYNPHLWGSDIIKICRALNVDIGFFATVVPMSEEKIKGLLEEVPLFMFADCGEDRYFSIVLKSVDSKYYPGTSKCVFLQEWQAELLGSEELTGIIGRCGIYSCRPVGCGAYPTKYDTAQKKVTVKDPHLILEKEHIMVEDSSAYKLCARALTCDDYAAFEEDYVKSAVLSQHEREFFIEVAKKWNKKPDVSDNFYAFLLREYADRIELINKQ